jgi:hypothetical protein
VLNLSANFSMSFSLSDLDSKTSFSCSLENVQSSENKSASFSLSTQMFFNMERFDL